MHSYRCLPQHTKNNLLNSIVLSQKQQQQRHFLLSGPRSLTAITALFPSDTFNITVSKHYHHHHHIRKFVSLPKSNIPVSGTFLVTRHAGSLGGGADSEERGKAKLVVCPATLAQEILSETEKVDVMAASIPQSDIEKLVTDLQSLGFDHGCIKTLLSRKMWLLRQPEATVTLCRLLLEHGFSLQLVSQTVDCIPLASQADFTTIPDRISEVLLFLRSFGFSEKEMFSLLNRDASVVFMDVSLIRSSVEMVKSFFPSTLTKKVVCASPNVLYDDWSSTHAKFDYCVFMMGYNQSDIVRSRLFSHSLDHIRDRHIFLQRAGVFQVVNKKLHPSLNVNPSLSSVVDSNELSFVKLVEGVNVSDYRVFKNMREIERENEEEIDNDDEKDQDDDDDEDNDEDEKLHMKGEFKERRRRSDALSVKDNQNRFRNKEKSKKKR